ncbi:MAG: DUF427 domain-containing protein [Acidobacteria bacterium]|nr:DUF427 domain-containing protein [Acidobacteriota bacterium]
MYRPKRIEPRPDQESVWDYPRPPRLELTSKEIKIIFNSITIARSVSAKRVLETSHPPVYYIPQSDILMEYLKPSYGNSFCEWKGDAIYYSVIINNKQAEKCAWRYPRPTKSFELIKDHLAFYATAMDACYVAGELVTPQPGNFYGGWITSDIVGPFKGEPGSWGW